MKETVMLIDVPDGYRILEASRELPVQKAQALLQSIRRQRYTVAQRCGQRVALTRHVIECPHCGRFLPAYPRFAADALPEWTGVFSQEAGPAAVQAWIQGAPGAAAVLRLNEPCGAQGMYTCPFCGQESAPFRRMRPVTLRRSRTAVSIECSTTDLRALLEQPWLAQDAVSLPLPLTERLEFRFGRGRTCMRLLGEQGQLAARDITDACADAAGVTVRLLRENRRLRRAVTQAFAACGVPVADAPYAGLRQLSEAARFIGFAPDFYRAIPYAVDTGRLDRSFYTAARRLHRAAALEQAFAASGLPQTKSVRRLFFRCPWLLFYPQQALAFWQAAESPSVYCRLLEDVRGCSWLAFLHQYPAAIDFFADYRRVKGASALRRRMEGPMAELQRRALLYTALNKRLRLQEQQKWSRKGRSRYVLPEPAYSVPVNYAPDERLEGAVGGCSFRWLRSTNEHRAAGRVLDNCLGTWNAGNPPVLLVSRGGVPVAAVEVLGDRITQAYLAHNRLLKNDPAVQHAVEVWRKRCGLQWLGDPNEEHEDEEEWELPFF